MLPGQIKIIPILFFVIVAGAYADITGVQRIHDNIDQKLKGVQLDRLSVSDKSEFLVSRFSLNKNMIVPVFGSTILDKTLYGSVRPPAIIADWTLGGFIPLGLAVTSFLAKERLSEKTRSSLNWTALGLYLATRVGVVVVINDHIHEYNKYMRLKLGLIH